MEKNRNKIAVSILLLLMAIPNFAQKITIQEAAEMAVKNNKDIKIGMLEMDRGQIDVSRTWKKILFRKRQGKRTSNIYHSHSHFSQAGN